MKTGLVWFKNDLRLHDNESLTEAIKNCDQLIFCYCVEPLLFKKLELGFKKSHINRFKFLEQSVKNLQKNLERKGGHLIIGDTSAVEIIPKLVDEYKVSVIFAEQEYASEELDLIERVKNNVSEVEFKLFWGKTLYHIDDIPFSIASIPLTSKAYRIPTSKESKPRQIIEVPGHLNAHPKAQSTDFPSCQNFGFAVKDYLNANPFIKGGESAGIKRLNYYLFETELLTGYRWTRNRSHGLDYSSKFSPYLALGCLSPREIYRSVKKYEQEIKKNQSTWWIVFELVWRDYFTFKGMRFGHQIFQTEGFKNREIDFENNRAYFERWCSGETGIPFIDAHMRQLNQTGFMSNRGRVNCASYFVHDLNIDWTWGAAYFESKLIDYDVSANWLNWHVQAFEIYYTNPVHQSNKYNAQAFIKEWVPELANQHDKAVLIPWEYDVGNYTKPIEIYKKWTRSINKIKAGTK